MAITDEQRKALKAVATKAAEVAELIRQDWGSAAPGGTQSRTNNMLPAHGPDHDLQNIEHQLGAVVNAIGTYLRRPTEGQS